jgi:hypothetical protein
MGSGLQGQSSLLFDDDGIWFASKEALLSRHVEAWGSGRYWKKHREKRRAEQSRAEQSTYGIVGCATNASHREDEESITEGKACADWGLLFLLYVSRNLDELLGAIWTSLWLHVGVRRC